MRFSRNQFEIFWALVIQFLSNQDLIGLYYEHSMLARLRDECEQVWLRGHVPVLKATEGILYLLPQPITGQACLKVVDNRPLGSYVELPNLEGLILDKIMGMK